MDESKEARVERQRAIREGREFRERTGSFLALGFDELDALTLADTDISVSYVRISLLERGATHDQAVRCVVGNSRAQRYSPHVH